MPTFIGCACVCLPVGHVTRPSLASEGYVLKLESDTSTREVLVATRKGYPSFHSALLVSASCSADQTNGTVVRSTLPRSRSYRL